VRGNGSCARCAASAPGRRPRAAQALPGPSGHIRRNRPHGWGYYWKSHYLPPLTDAAIDALAEHAWRKSSSASYTLLIHLGGQIARLPGRHSAAGGRDAKHAIVINSAWAEGGPAHADIGWCRETFRAMQPHATGEVYVNFVHNDEGDPDETHGCWARTAPQD
jgi:hypothetical protein